MAMKKKAYKDMSPNEKYQQNRLRGIKAAKTRKVKAALLDAVNKSNVFYSEEAPEPQYNDNPAPMKTLVTRIAELEQHLKFFVSSYNDSMINMRKITEDLQGQIESLSNKVG